MVVVRRQRVKELQRTAMLGTTHLLREALMWKYKIFSMGNNTTCNPDCWECNEAVYQSLKNSEKAHDSVRKEILYNIIIDTLLGKPKRRWEGNINLDRHKVGFGDMDWIGLAQDKDSWRTLVNAVMNLRVPWNAGNFLTSCKPVSCSRWTLHRGVSELVSRKASK